MVVWCPCPVPVRGSTCGTARWPHWAKSPGMLSEFLSISLVRVSQIMTLSGPLLACALGGCLVAGLVYLRARRFERFLKEETEKVELIARHDEARQGSLAELLLDLPAPARRFFQRSIANASSEGQEIMQFRCARRATGSAPATSAARANPAAPPAAGGAPCVCFGRGLCLRTGW